MPLCLTRSLFSPTVIIITPFAPTHNRPGPPSVFVPVPFSLAPSGLSPAQSEFNYLNTARTLELYGVELHYARVSKVLFCVYAPVCWGLLLYICICEYICCYSLYSRRRQIILTRNVTQLAVSESIPRKKNKNPNLDRTDWTLLLFPREPSRRENRLYSRWWCHTVQKGHAVASRKCHQTAAALLMDFLSCKMLALSNSWHCSGMSRLIILCLKLAFQHTLRKAVVKLTAIWTFWEPC